MTEMRPVPGYEGLYSVTNDGRVWSHQKRHGRGSIRSGRWLSPGKTSSKYLSVVLHKDDKPKSFLLHRLVALVWVQNDEPRRLIEVRHDDGDKFNNSASNLIWGTRKEIRRASIARQKGLITSTMKDSYAV